MRNVDKYIVSVAHDILCAMSESGSDVMKYLPDDFQKFCAFDESYDGELVRKLVGWLKAGEKKYVVRVGEFYVGESREERFLSGKEVVVRKGYELFYTLAEALPLKEEELVEVAKAFSDCGKVSFMEYYG